MTRWIDIVGIGEEGLPGLSPNALEALTSADVIIGGDRHHHLSDSIRAQRMSWPHPFDALIETIKDLKGRRLVILATGDPLWYSIGARLTRAIPVEEIRFHPQLSAFQWAAARLGWSLADVETITAHGRPVEQVIPYLRPSARLLILTAGAETAVEIARILQDRGLGESSMTVFGHLGGANETRDEGTASDWATTSPTLPAFNTLAVHCKGAVSELFSRCPGLPDEAFEHDGMLTKQSVRAISLSKLMPARGEVLWDLGCGCGSVAIEWMRAAPDAVAVGIDRNADRLAMARANATKLGAPALMLIRGNIPAELSSLPEPGGTRPDLRRPHAIFVGGGITDGALDIAWDALNRGGRLVANAVTLESESILLAFHAVHCGRLDRISIETASPVGRMTGWRPSMTVTQLALIK